MFCRGQDLEKVEKIIKSLSLRVLPREMKTKDERQLLQTIMMQWLPLSTALLVSVVEQLPAPPQAQKERMPHVLESAPGSEAVSEVVKNAIFNFDVRPEAPVVAYVSKMVSVPGEELKKIRRVKLSAAEMRELGRKRTVELARQIAAQDNVAEGAEAPGGGDNEEPGEKEKLEEEEEEREHLIGFARVYSGTVKIGQELYVLGPKYNPMHPNQHIQRVKVADLYYMMGKDLEALDEVPAGNVFGIAGLEGKILKSGTLISVENGGLNLAGVNLGAAPIVRVALEPRNPSEMGKLIEGMKLLEQADPCAEYIVQDNGEHVILTAGELHLEVSCSIPLSDRVESRLMVPAAVLERSQRAVRKDRYPVIISYRPIPRDYRCRLGDGFSERPKPPSRHRQRHNSIQADHGQGTNETSTARCNEIPGQE